MRTWAECDGHESTDGPIGNVVHCDGTCTTTGRAAKAAAGRAPHTCETEDCDTPDEHVRQCASCDGYTCHQHGGYSHEAGEYFCNDPAGCEARYDERRLNDAWKRSIVAPRADR